MSDSNENTSSSREKSSEGDKNASPSDEEKDRIPHDEYEEMMTESPKFIEGCEAHNLKFLATIKEPEFDRFKKIFPGPTDNWDDPLVHRTVQEESLGDPRGTFHFPDDEDLREEIQDRMKRCEIALEPKEGQLTLEREEDLLWVARMLVQCGKIYADESDYGRWMALAETFQMKQHTTGSGLPATLGFPFWRFFGFTS